MRTPHSIGTRRANMTELVVGHSSRRIDKLLLALALFGLASPAVAETCRYTQQDLVDAGSPNAYIDLMDGGRLKFSDGNAVCTYYGDDSGQHIKCPGKAEMSFMFAGKSAHDFPAEDIIIFADTAWYRDPKCK